MFTKDQWHEIDTANLKGQSAKAYLAYQEANEEMKLARENLEGILTAAVDDRIPAGLEARFAYRWGKVSVSAVEPRTKSAKSGGKIKL